MNTSSPVTLLLLGGAALGVSAIVGKVLVDAVQGAEVREHGKRSEFDDAARLVGSMVGISVTLLQLPKVYEEAKALIEAGKLPPEIQAITE